MRKRPENGNTRPSDKLIRNWVKAAGYGLGIYALSTFFLDSVNLDLRVNPYGDFGPKVGLVNSELNDLMDQADKLISQRDFLGALETYKQAIANDPNNFNLILMTLEFIEDSFPYENLEFEYELLRRAHILEPDNREIASKYALNVWTKGQEKVAAALDAIQLGNNSGKIHEALGRGYLETQQWNEAIQAFEDAINLNYIDDGSIYYLLIFAYDSSGQIDPRNSAIQEALSDPRTNKVWRGYIEQDFQR